MLEDSLKNYKDTIKDLKNERAEGLERIKELKKELEVA
jgi:hypothetical protein